MSDLEFHISHIYICLGYNMTISYSIYKDGENTGTNFWTRFEVGNHD